MVMAGCGFASPDVSGDSLVAFVRDATLPGTTIRTDAWKGYNGLPKLGYDRQPINISASGDPAHVHLPAVHRVASLLQRWPLGTHQGVQPSAARRCTALTRPQNCQLNCSASLLRLGRRPAITAVLPRQNCAARARSPRLLWSAAKLFRLISVCGCCLS